MTTITKFLLVSVLGWNVAMGIPTRERLKAMGLSEAVEDNGPLIKAPRMQLASLSSSNSWCDTMEQQEGWFKCADGKDPWCVHPYLRCNNKEDCKDLSDEQQCAGNAPPQDSRPTAFYCYGCTTRQRKMLDHHNAFRRAEGASNMNELHWSVDDEQAAEAQANLCAVPDWKENAHGNMEPDYGQNVARYFYPGQLSDDQVLDMITWWYEEKANYTYNSDNCETDAVCGHYLAMVNAYERNVGCSLKLCDRVKNGERKNFWNLVCNYSVWPNWKVWTSHPDQPFIQGGSCTKCQPGLECRNKLCG